MPNWFLYLIWIELPDKSKTLKSYLAYNNLHTHIFTLLINQWVRQPHNLQRLLRSISSNRSLLLVIWFPFIS